MAPRRRGNAAGVKARCTTVSLRTHGGLRISADTDQLTGPRAIRPTKGRQISPGHPARPGHPGPPARPVRTAHQVRRGGVAPKGA